MDAAESCGRPGQPRNTRRPERRKRVRTSLHWPITLFRGQSAGAIESTTRNLSSEGLYCLARGPFVTGERLLGLLRIQSSDPTGKEETWLLRVQLRVVRVEPADVDGCRGIACRIEEYYFAPMGAAERSAT